MPSQAAADSLVSEDGLRADAFFWLTINETQWISQIVKGLDNFFLCRNIDCRIFLPSTCWIQEYKLDEPAWSYGDSTVSGDAPRRACDIDGPRSLVGVV